jgi:hypothetical protein
MPTSSTSQTLGEKQLVIYLTKRGIDPKRIPSAAMREIVDTASATMDLAALRNSQALVMYMGTLKAYSDVIADYCTKPAQHRENSDQVICDILKSHGVKPALG